MVERYGVYDEQPIEGDKKGGNDKIIKQGEEYRDAEMKKIESRLSASSSNQQQENEWEKEGNLVNDINKSGNSVEAINNLVNKIEESNEENGEQYMNNNNLIKDILYLMNNLRRIDFADLKGSDRQEKISNAKTKIAKIAFKNGGWKTVLDNWDSLNDLKKEDKENLVGVFKNMIEKAERKPGKSPDLIGVKLDTVNTASEGENEKGEEKVWKDVYYDYLENDNSFKSKLLKDPDSLILFERIKTDKMAAVNDKFIDELSEAYKISGNDRNVNISLGGGEKIGETGEEEPEVTNPGSSPEEGLESGDELGPWDGQDADIFSGGDLSGVGPEGNDEDGL